MNKRSVIICLVVSIVLITISISWAGIAGNKQRFLWRQPATTQNDGEDKRTLREKARQSRKIVDTENPTNLPSLATLDDLARASDIVVIGTAKSNGSKLSQDEKKITLDYEMVAEKVYKGSLSQGGVFTVSLPGGQVVFPDGSTAAISTPWFKKMQNDKTYLLFLKQEQGRPFTTVGGPRGLFQIPTDATSRKVQAHTLIANDPLLKYNDVEVRAFLRELRKSFSKEKDTSSNTK